MTDIELSIMFVNDAALEALRLSLQEFEAQHNVQVANLELDIEQTISKYIEPLAKELNHSLAS